MLFKVFAVYDKKAEAYLPPFFVSTNGVAIRSFMDACADKSHQFAKYPEDYRLTYLGDWDDSDGLFDVADKMPSIIAEAKDFVEPEKQVVLPLK